MVGWQICLVALIHNGVCRLDVRRKKLSIKKGRRVSIVRKLVPDGQ